MLHAVAYNSFCMRVRLLRDRTEEMCFQNVGHLGCDTRAHNCVCGQAYTHIRIVYRSTSHKYTAREFYVKTVDIHISSEVSSAEVARLE